MFIHEEMNVLINLTVGNSSQCILHCEYTYQYVYRIWIIQYVYQTITLCILSI